MAIHDTIGDFLTLIRNASAVKQTKVSGSFTNLRLGIAKILKEEGYITSYQESELQSGKKDLTLTLKYVDGQSVIKNIQRFSKPGRRLYSGYQEFPKVLGGLGIAIISTSKGIMKDRDARAKKVGGEILCTVY